MTVKIQAELTNTFDGKFDNLLYIEAFAVLFSQSSVYFIPPKELKYYCRLLGMKIDKNFFVTNSTLAQAQNINNIKKHIFFRLSSHFKSDIDSIVLLDFFYSVGVAFYGEIIKKNNYVIVTNDSTFQSNNKYMYTLGQVGCRVVIVQFDEDGFLLSHYRKKCFSKLLLDICEAIIRCDYKKLKCFVISYDPIEDSILLKQALSPFCDNIEIYYHEKPPSSYNIKLCTESDSKIYYDEAVVKKVKNPCFLKLNRTIMLKPFFAIKYKEMLFTKFKK